MSLPADAPNWAHELERQLRAEIERAKFPPTRLKAQLSKGTRAGQVAYVPDAAGGPTIVFWDATNSVWRINQATVLS